MSRLNLFSGLFGAAFGALFTAAGLNQYDTIHGMLLLENLAPYLIMGSAVATAAPILWILERRRWRTPLGGQLRLQRVPIRSRHVSGGVIFGIGWAITGACPGTASTTLGAGSLMGIILIAGFLAGMALRDAHVSLTIAETVPAPTPAGD
jgi:uncharacterized membrane protein YedE/YeeE